MKSAPGHNKQQNLDAERKQSPPDRPPPDRQGQMKQAALQVNQQQRHEAIKETRQQEQAREAAKQKTTEKGKEHER